MTSPLRREEIDAVKRAIAIAEGPNESAPTERKSTARLLRDWLADPMLLRTPEIVIPHLAVEGRASLLSGREKIGKSTLAAGAVAAASWGHPVLGVPLTEPIRTLWYAFDEPPADTVRRNAALGANPLGIVVNDEQPHSFGELVASLECDLEEFENVGCVVIDTLSRVFARSGIDPNSSREVEPAIANLVDFFHRQNVAAILLYHTGKAGREYRGSTAIGATVDEVLTLRRRGATEDDDFDDDTADDGRRLLIQDGRNLRGRIHLSYRDGAYQPYEETAAPRDKLLEALRDHGAVVGRAELTKLAGVRKSVGLKTIGELVGSGAIIENGRHLKLGSASSHEFPKAGTEGEPHAEPNTAAGSRSVQVGVPQTGTEELALALDSRPRRINNGVNEVLRPTAHGDQWVEEDVA